MKRKPKTSKLVRYFQSYNYLGFVVGSLFVFASFLPSLLPRGMALQGLLSAVLFCIGYGLGVLASLVIREFKPKEPAPETKSVTVRISLGVAAVIYVICLFLYVQWQHEAAQLVSRQPTNAASVLGITLILLLTAVLIILISRSIVSLGRWLRRLVRRFLPPRLAYGLTIVLTVLVVVGLVNGVIFNATRSFLNEAFGTKNGTTSEGVTKPTVAELSGSPQSLIKWESLGRQGRSFVSNGQNTKKLAEFSGAAATQPVRIYSGLESADDTTARAQLAVRDLKRAGGFDRRVLVVVTTTGTGWVDEQGVEGLEYMYNGDTAMVAMQYSYLPSWLSFLVDQSKAQDAGIELYNAVLAEWQKLPLESRPKLVVFGESLGSFGGESAFTGWSSFKATANGAVWVGPPNFNHLWSATTAARDVGSPEILPVVDKGETVRYATQESDLSVVPLSQWQSPRAVYLQNPSDPIVWWSPHLLFNKPDWLKEKPGADVNPDMFWLPIITFWHVTGDMAFSTGVPDNHGHKYGTMPTAAWSYVAPPDGWTTQQTEKLRTFLSQ
jgi:uncharacterized membrane protein